MIIIKDSNTHCMIVIIILVITVPSCSHAEPPGPLELHLGMLIAVSQQFLFAAF